MRPFILLALICSSTLFGAHFNFTPLDSSWELVDEETCCNTEVEEFYENGEAVFGMIIMPRYEANFPLGLTSQFEDDDDDVPTVLLAEDENSMLWEVKEDGYHTLAKVFQTPTRLATALFASEAISDEQRSEWITYLQNEISLQDDDLFPTAQFKLELAPTWECVEDRGHTQIWRCNSDEIMTMIAPKNTYHLQGMLNYHRNSMDVVYQDTGVALYEKAESYGFYHCIKTIEVPGGVAAIYYRGTDGSMSSFIDAVELENID